MHFIDDNPPVSPPTLIPLQLRIQQLKTNNKTASNLSAKNLQEMRQQILRNKEDNHFFQKEINARKAKMQQTKIIIHEIFIGIRKNSRLSMTNKNYIIDNKQKNQSVFPVYTDQIQRKEQVEKQDSLMYTCSKFIENSNQSKIKINNISMNNNFSQANIKKRKSNDSFTEFVPSNKDYFLTKTKKLQINTQAARNIRTQPSLYHQDEYLQKSNLQKEKKQQNKNNEYFNFFKAEQSYYQIHTLQDSNGQYFHPKSKEKQINQISLISKIQKASLNKKEDQSLKKHSLEEEQKRLLIDKSSLGQQFHKKRYLSKERNNCIQEKSKISQNQFGKDTINFNFQLTSKGNEFNQKNYIPSSNQNIKSNKFIENNEGEAHLGLHSLGFDSKIFRGLSKNNQIQQKRSRESKLIQNSQIDQFKTIKLQSEEQNKKTNILKKDAMKNDFTPIKNSQPIYKDQSSLKNNYKHQVLEKKKSLLYLNNDKKRLEHQHMVSSKKISPHQKGKAKSYEKIYNGNANLKNDDYPTKIPPNMIDYLETQTGTKTNLENNTQINLYLENNIQKKINQSYYIRQSSPKNVVNYQVKKIPQSLVDRNNLYRQEISGSPIYSPYKEQSGIKFYSNPKQFIKTHYSNSKAQESSQLQNYKQQSPLINNPSEKNESPRQNTQFIYERAKKYQKNDKIEKNNKPEKTPVKYKSPTEKSLYKQNPVLPYILQSPINLTSSKMQKKNETDKQKKFYKVEYYRK